MTKYVTFGIVVLLACTCLFSCHKKKTNRQFFEEHLEKNIEACAIPFIAKGIDREKAKSVCSCLMETVYRIDSTIFTIKASEQEQAINKLMNEHEEEISKCLIPLMTLEGITEEAKKN